MLNTHPADRPLDDEDSLFSELERLELPAVFYAACDDAYEYLRRLRDSNPDINHGRIRTQRCLANDAVLRRVHAALKDRQGLEFREVPGAECEVLIVEHPSCEIRFKKIDRMGRTSNIPTARQRKLLGVAGQQYMFGSAPKTILTVGYQPDDDLCELVQVSIGVEGGGSYRIAMPPADTIGAITRMIRTNLGEESA